MAEYIEREAAMLQIDAADFVRDDNFEGGATLLFCDDVVDRLSAIPAADVRPVVRGQIEEDENTYLWCSECGCNLTLSAYTMPNGNLILRPNFCPNCGADMREET